MGDQSAIKKFMKKIKLGFVLIFPLLLIFLFFFYYTLSSYLNLSKENQKEEKPTPQSSSEVFEEKEAAFLVTQKESTKKLDDGLYHQKIVLTDQANPEIQRKLQFNILKINPQKRRLKLLINGNLKGLLKEIFITNNCLAGTNGMFFTKENTLIGLLIENSKIIHPKKSSRLTTGIFYLDKQKNPHIVSTNAFSNSNQSFALQAGPIILHSDGSTEIKSDDKKRVPRTFTAIDNNKQTYLIVAKDETGLQTHGLSLFEAYKIFSNKNLNLGVNFLAVLNLDGGSSTTFYTPNFYLKEEKFTQNGICIL